MEPLPPYQRVYSAGALPADPVIVEAYAIHTVVVVIPDVKSAQLREPIASVFTLTGVIFVPFKDSVNNVGAPPAPPVALPITTLPYTFNSVGVLYWNDGWLL
jgi:hypothetical protein